ncbi:MAG: aldehyde dehydrogenase family protein [Myxococcota bacterium]|jgi:aldehyde dehydrogenase (NAD+)|nr:aldehyde dehydrogenase family protein [Myxococcota bacterium]
MASFDPETRNLIDGKLVPASNGAQFENINPATEEVIGVAADGTPDDMEVAIAAARRAFDETSWSTDHEFRKHCLEQLNAALDEAREDLRQIVVAEAGSPIMITYQVQVDSYIDSMPYWSDLATSYTYESPMSDIEFMGNTQARIIRREAVGVVGAITPWNFPLYLNLAKIGPALAAGNTLILKPAPDTPWSATHLGKLVSEKTDIPAGVLNIVASSDHGVGAMLSTDPRVDLVTFTGSTATGRAVMQAASATVKKTFLELGGKSATIILDDIDIDAAAPMAGIAVCTHAGQGCAIQTRTLLPRARYEEGIEKIAATMSSVNYGDPLDPSNLMGPVVSKKQQERVLSYIEQGKQAGARVVVGGGTPAHLEKGYFIEPTLLADVDPDSVVAQEEIFGPVLCVIPYEDEADAIRIANNSMYGLSGAIWSGDTERALSVARKIRTGTLSVNGAQWFDVDTPFGGYRQSGVGRENGLAGFEEYLETKVIALPK